MSKATLTDLTQEDLANMSTDDKMDAMLKHLQADPTKQVVRKNTQGGVGTISYFEEEPGRRAGKRKSLRYRELQQLEDLRNAGYENQFRSLGEFLAGVARSKFDNHSMGQEFFKKYNATRESMIKSLDAIDPKLKAIGLNTFNSDSAGTLVIPEFASAIMERDYDYQNLWDQTDNYSVSGNTMTFPRVQDTNRTDGNRSGGLISKWVGEENQYEPSYPKVGSFRLTLKKLTVLVYVTEELLEDASYALEQWVSRAVRRELDFALNEAAMRGTGANEPLGYLNSGSLVVVAKEAGQAADSVVAENIINMWKCRLGGQDTSGLKWHMNQEAESEVLMMVLDPTGTGAGALVFTPPGGLSGTPYATLMGKEVVPTEHNSALGDQGDITLADMKHMITMSKGGVTESVSQHVEFVRDQVCYKYSQRADGRPIDDEATTPARGSTGYKQSAFIALAARA